MMLGHKHIVTEVGHHAPGFYSAMFLDGSLEAMDIRTVADLRARFRERHGLLGHLSGAIPGLLAPAGPFGQGQHFAMGGALLNPGTLFPVTIGDGGLGEPYILSAFMHFRTAFRRVTNFLPVLVWNGYSQEHHSMVSLMSNDTMIAYRKAHGFEDVILVDAKAFDDSGQDGAYVDSTRFSPSQRLAFQGAVLESIDRAAKQALGGRLTAFIIKQLKGAGVHATAPTRTTCIPPTRWMRAHHGRPQAPRAELEAWHPCAGPICAAPAAAPPPRPWRPSASARCPISACCRSGNSRPVRTRCRPRPWARWSAPWVSATRSSS